MNHFCTISTVSHLYKTYALAESLQNQKRDFVLHVLVSDSDENFTSENCKFWRLRDFKNITAANSIIAKYKKHSDKLRWSLKSVFMELLLENSTDKILYVDNDQFFYADYQFLFDLLNDKSFLLTPHYYKHNPQKEQNWLEANFKVGLYNAGFIGANKAALKTLRWWAACCLYRCEKNAWRGLFDDQKYLDLIPVIDAKAHVVRHKGCNVAGWNNELCQRQEINGELQIGEGFSLVFIHFNAFTIREIAEGRDAMLLPAYNLYVATLKKYKANLVVEELYGKQPLIEKVKYNIWKMITDLGL